MENVDRIEMLLKVNAETNIQRDKILIWANRRLNNDKRKYDKEYDFYVLKFYNLITCSSIDLFKLSRISIEFLEMGEYIPHKTKTDLQVHFLYSELTKEVVKRIYDWTEKNQTGTPDVKALLHSLRTNILYVKSKPVSQDEDPNDDDPKKKG